MEPFHDSWCFSCPSCGTQGSTLPALSLAHDGSGTLDEQARRAGIRATRAENDARIVRALASRATGRLLDIGTGYGWFLDEARAAGFDAVGIEPDPDVAATPLTRGLDVRAGFFPDVLTASERFDVACFNDVLEHLSDVATALRHVTAVLRPRGLLAVNIPVQDGPIYRAAVRLSRVSVDGPLRRMWQFGFPSPHLWYFTRASLLLMLKKHGFTPVSAIWLPSVNAQGMWHRVRYGGSGALASIAATGIATVAAPCLRRMSPTDTLLIIARRADA